MGMGHTWDITMGNEGAYATIWGDAKFQLNNHENVVGEPIFSLGLIKGYTYHENAQLHLTSFPVIVSFPTNETNTAFLMYRFEHFSDAFGTAEEESLRQANQDAEYDRAGRPGEAQEHRDQHREDNAERPQ